MADYERYCAACEELKKNAPDFAENGVTSEVCASLKNDTGLGGRNDDCKDLTDANDCLVGGMIDDIEMYDPCDWKCYMLQFVPNVHNVLSAIICAICGLWDNIHKLWAKIAEILKEIDRMKQDIEALKARFNCVSQNFKTLVTYLNNNQAAAPKIRYWKNRGSDDSSWYWPNKVGAKHRFNIYMNANGASSGNQVADRDYIVILSCCADSSNVTGRGGTLGWEVAYWTSSNTMSEDDIVDLYGMHWYQGNVTTDISTTLTSAVYVKKGDYIKGIAVCTDGSRAGGSWRCHQYVITWIPVASGSIPSDLLTNC